MMQPFKYALHVANRLPCMNSTVLRYVKYTLNAIPPIGISFLMLWVYNVYAIQNAFPLLEKESESVNALLMLIGFHFFYVMFLWSYYRTVFGRAPAIQKHEKEPLDPVRAEDDERIRYCTTCKGYKLGRMHHCSWCNVCIDKMDHHCPWVGNCIGRHNYKPFYLMLTYCVSLCAWGVSTLSKHHIPGTSHGSVLVLASSVLLGVGILWSFHTYLIFTNTTTLECGIFLAEGRYCCVNGTTPFPYHRGIFGNLREVLGKDVLLWWIPIVQVENHRSNILPQTTSDIL